ncbi:putative regulatory protein, FmdB family [Candidatus Sulfopaludibacter sp. SbA6]|nr:putative regulatory protein, FmdB family [Candidatus Sulfopaludibacter sp. SbA6]
MPLYEYKCHQCGKNFEVRQKFADEPLAVHEDCGGDVERLISAPTLHFKGTGWYVTDYGPKANSSGKNGSNGKSESKNESSKSESSKSESSKSESSKSESSKSESSKSESSKSESKSERSSKPESKNT